LNWRALKEKIIKILVNLKLLKISGMERGNNDIHGYSVLAWKPGTTIYMVPHSPVKSTSPIYPQLPPFTPFTG